MEVSDYIAILALIVSAISLITSFYFGYRDKVNLKTECKYFDFHPEYDRAHLNIKITNHGRRPALLRWFGGRLRNGKWQAEGFEGKDSIKRLGEHEFYHRKFYKDDILAISPDDESEYVELWFEDSLGYRHVVKGSKKGIEKLSKS